MLAAAAVGFAVWMVTSDRDDGEFRPDELLESEANVAAAKLIRDNYALFELYYLMDYDQNTHFQPEPYGLEPEDGYYSLKPGVIGYDSVEQIFELADSTFKPNIAEEIKMFSPFTDEGKPVYIERDGKIGINETFEPKKDYDLKWGDVPITLTFDSETKCMIEITLTDSDGGEVIKQINMEKEQDGVWRLENIVF